MDISVIIPTYNRAERLPGLFEHWRAVDAATRCRYEIIVSDDGSTDNTLEVVKGIEGLPIVLLENEHGGASRARNSAIRAARGRRLLIIGDDIYPEPELVNQHHELGERLGDKVAVLGQVDWHPELAVNHLMRHITEIGCEQFSYSCLPVHDYTDFRHFYTCNISVDRTFLNKEETLFDLTFDKYGFEDIELGYRLAQRGMRIYYAPELFGYHYHPYNVAGFCRRQRFAGEMAVVFASLHPEVERFMHSETIVSDYRLYAEMAESEPGVAAAAPERLIDETISRCEAYERLLPRAEGRARAYLEQSLSALYRRLFRAMYEVGVLSKRLGEGAFEAYVVSRYLSNDDFWQHRIESERLLAPYSERDRDYIVDTLGTWQTLTRTELQHRLFGLEQELHHARVRPTLKARVIARLKRSSKVRRLYGALMPVLGRFGIGAASRRVPPASPSAVANFAVIVREAIGGDQAREHYRRFGEANPLYRLADDGMLHRLDERGEEGAGVPVDGLSEAWCYLPAEWSNRLTPAQIHTALLALGLNGIDLAVVSHTLEEPPLVRIGRFDNHALFDSRLLPEMLSDRLDHARGRGRVLRLLPGREEGMAEQRLERLVSLDRVEGGRFAFGGQRAGELSRRLPGMAPFSKERPVVFVLPMYFAVGGVERNTVEIMRSLRHKYHFVLITSERLSAAQGSLHHQAAPLCEAVYDLAEAVDHDLYFPALEHLRDLYRPDIVWVCNGSPWFVENARSIRTLFGAQAIIDQEAYDDRVGWITHYGNPGIQSFDRFIAINRRILKVFVERYGIPRERIDLIYSAVDTAKFEAFLREAPSPESLRERHSLPEGKRLVVFMGRLTEQKQPMRFLRMAEARAAVAPEEHFLLIGDGELAEEAERYIAERRLRNVQRIPFVEHTPEIFSLASAMVVSSLYEGLPIAMLEALCMGVPVVATDVGDIAWALERFSGGVVVPETADDDRLIAAFSGLMADLPGYTEALAARRDEVMGFFSSATIAAQYEHCWDEALAARAN